MPVDKSRYPDNWKQISLSIRTRAGNRCEQCGVNNGALIIRSNVDASRYIVYNAGSDRWSYPNGESIRLSEFPDEYDGKDVIVVLTVHHIGVDKPDGTKGDTHDKMDCRDENLIALCQRCHLKADMATHIENARKTRIEKRLKALKAGGQLAMF